MSKLKVQGYNPDVLSCIASLSNDEVFTPPDIVNAMLDTLPKELFENPKTTFLDPACKSGVFLREIAKRLIKGLENKIPNLEKRIDHILHNQLFGIAITELTSLLSRRSLYCSKYADGKYSVSFFKNPQGNIRFKHTLHTWEKGKCVFCGASQAEYGEESRSGLESHAYEFIHTLSPEKIFNMKFDVVIGNPPYQLNIGIEQENYAIPIYDQFILQSKKLRPKFLCMIVPSRWYAGGRGLDDFRKEMLNDDRIKELHDFPNANDCFPGIKLKGGVCFFLWDNNFKGDCEISTYSEGKLLNKLKRPLIETGCTTLIRFNEAIPILRKIQKFNEQSFMQLISPQTPFGIISSFKDYKSNPFPNSIKIYITKGVGYTDKKNITKNTDMSHSHKIFITKSYGAGDGFPHQILNKPFIGDYDSCCTQTYLTIGPFPNKAHTQNALRYISSKFFRFMVMLKKNTQDAMRGVYQFVPMQDFSKPWTDEELYKKYNLTDEEIAFIESMIKPMNIEEANEEES